MMRSILQRNEQYALLDFYLLSYYSVDSKEGETECLVTNQYYYGVVGNDDGV